MNTPENDKSKDIEGQFVTDVEELCSKFKRINIQDVQKDLVSNVLFVLLLAWGFVEKQKF